MRFDNEDMYSGTSLKDSEGILEEDIVVVFSQNNEVITSKGNPRDIWKRYFRSKSKSNINF